jgi:hypothetical protein
MFGMGGGSAGFGDSEAQAAARTAAAQQNHVGSRGINPYILA